MKNKAPGKTLLQTVGIVVIVLGVISFIGAVSSIMMGNTINNQGLSEEMKAAFEAVGTAVPTAQEMMVAGVLSAVQSVIYIAAGAIGVKFCNRVEKGKLCMIWGFLMLALWVADGAYGAVQGSFNLISMLISAIFPVLYTWGAIKNKDAASTENA